MIVQIPPHRDHGASIEGRVYELRHDGAHPADMIRYEPSHPGRVNLIELLGSADAAFGWLNKPEQLLDLIQSCSGAATGDGTGGKAAELSLCEAGP